MKNHRQWKTIEVTVNGETLTVERLTNNNNGNPEYVIHFLALGIEPKDYGNIKGLKMFRSKWFKGGYVFESYGIEQTLKWALETVKHYYNPYVTKPNQKQIDSMIRLGKKIERQTQEGLAGGFLNQCYSMNGQTYDAYCLINNRPEYTNEQGYILYNGFSNKAEFIKDSE